LSIKSAFKNYFWMILWHWSLENWLMKIVVFFCLHLENYMQFIQHLLKFTI